MADNQGSFVTGLTLGLFAGAASYFLLLTPEGKKMRTKLEKEWQAAQAAGATKLPPENPHIISVRSLFGTLREVITQAAQNSTQAHPTHKPRRPSAKKTDPRFKGV